MTQSNECRRPPRRCTFGAVSVRGRNHSFGSWLPLAATVPSLGATASTKSDRKGAPLCNLLEADLTHLVSRAREGFLAFLVEEADFGTLITIRRIFMVHLKLPGLR
ncbi:hypothetical protein D3C76_1123720 [compost metagenome]